MFCRHPVGVSRFNHSANYNSAVPGLLSTCRGLWMSGHFCAASYVRQKNKIVSLSLPFSFSLPPFVILLGLWKVTLCGRRLCMRLFTRSHPEALTWHHALRSAIAALPPTLSPTQMLISDIQVPGFCEAFGDVQVTKGQQSLKRNHLLVNFIENVTFLGLCASPTEFANPSSAGMWGGSGGPRMCVPAEPCTHMYDDATACTAPSTTLQAPSTTL